MHGVARNRGRRIGAAGLGLPGLDRLFVRLLDRIDRGLAEGSIVATLPGGTMRTLGGRAPGPAAVVDLRRWRALVRLATGGSAGWYEAWAAGEWASPDPVALFELFVRNRASLGGTARARVWSRLGRRIAHLARRNDREGSRRNIEYHYDLGNDFYAAWLDPGMTYSSAMFVQAHDQPTPVRTELVEVPSFLREERTVVGLRPPSARQAQHERIGGRSLDLEAAQHRKLAAILERTGTRPGDTILEIGCGWGSFAQVAADAGRRVHGLTLSAEQKAYVDARALPGVEVSLTDYRDAAGSYDAVASIEMVEAVGQDYWPEYLATIARVLKPGGRAAIQYIAIDDAIFDSYASNVDFIQSYVFPGGLLLSERRFRAIAARHGLAWTDRAGFGASYAETLRQWREAFDAADREGRLPGDLDRDFRDLWRYYLMYCEGGFRGGGIDVAQVTLIKGG